LSFASQVGVLMEVFWTRKDYKAINAESMTLAPYFLPVLLNGRGF